MVIWTAEIKELDNLYESFKGQFPDILKELEQLIRTQDPNVVMLYSRRCLEVIVTDLCETELKRPRKTEPLKGIIDKLNSEEKVPAHIITSMQGLNSLSNYGAHPKDFDPEQVKPVLNNLAIIIKWYLKYKDFKITSTSIGTGEKNETDKMNPKVEPVKEDPKPSKRRVLWISGLLLFIATGFIVSNRLHLFGNSIEKSIAVLPFANFSNDPEQDYFSDAMVDEILDRLCKVGDLKVSSRTSSMNYRNTNLSIKKIGDELGVSTILEGSVRKIDTRIRIIVQLVDAKNDKHLWSETYDRDYADIFNLTSEIAETIAKELNAVITTQEKQHIEKAPTANMDAYEDYIIGRHKWRNFTPDDLMIAMQYFESAREKDHDYALAYLGISDVWFGLLQLGYLPPSEPDPVGKYMSALTKALELDSTLAEVHYSLGNMYGFNWDWKACEREYDIALKINPNYSDVYAAQSNLLALMGRTEESIEKIETALRLDPQNIFNRVLHGITMLFARRYDDAAASLQGALSSEPNNFLAMNALPSVFHMLGKYDEGLNAWKSFVISFYDNGQTDYDQIFDYNQTEDGYQEALSNMADTLVAQLETIPFDKFNIALMYACAGNKEKTYGMLDLSYEEHNPNFGFLINPCFDFVREEPRFKDLCEKINLTI